MAGWLDDIISIIPAVGELFGAGGSIADLFAGDSSKNLSEEQLHNQQFLQLKALQMAKAGQTNARGDVLKYDPKTNMWTTTPSAETADLIASADAAQRALLNTDVPRARQEAIRETGARGRASQAADAALTEYQRYNPMTPERLSADMYTQASRGLKEGYDQVSGDVSRQAIRAGTGGGQLLDQLSRSYARDLANARVNSRVSALTTSADVNNSRRGALLNNASSLRSMASGVPAITGSPDTLNAQLSSLLNSRAAGASGAVTNASGITGTGYQNLIGQNTNYYQDLGMAGSDLASGLGAILDRFNSSPGSNPATSTTPTSSGRSDPYNPYAGNVSF